MYLELQAILLVICLRPRLFTVIVGDLIGSRDIPDRRRVSRTIRSAIQRLSREFADEFYAPLELVPGMDEISGVLKLPTVAYRACRTLNRNIHPHRFRFAIVGDALDVGVTTKMHGR